jgi:toxin ParE1/3/4
MPHIFTRPRAGADLVDIWTYIAQDSPANADRLLDRIRDTLSRLAAMPFMGQARFDLAPGLRMFPVGNYLMFFRPIESGIDVKRDGRGSIANMAKTPWVIGTFDTDVKITAVVRV